MKKLIKPAEEAQYEMFCDATEVPLCWSKWLLELSEYSVLGCTIRFNNNYGAIMDSLQPIEIHLSEDVTNEFLNWLKEKYPDSEFIKSCLNETI